MFTEGIKRDENLQIKANLKQFRGNREAQATRC